MTAAKNSPSVSSAICSSVTGSGGTGIVREVPNRSNVTVPSGVPRATV